VYLFCLLYDKIPHRCLHFARIQLKVKDSEKKLVSVRNAKHNIFKLLATKISVPLVFYGSVFILSVPDFTLF